MERDEMKLSGRLRILHKRGRRVISDKTIDNLIVTAGKNYVATFLQAASTAGFSHIAIGTGANPEDVANTALQTETHRQASSNSVAGNVAEFETTFTSTLVETIAEAGLLNNSVGGTMLSRKLIGPHNVIVGDTLTITWQITVS
ncbi:MAG: hypothetical protein WC350_05540 [Candidatus Micrarchaeia archaeon]|jgi:methanogenic corrinoid protein MtbC1